MLRITTQQDSRGEVVIVDGHLDADGVAEVERVVAGLVGAVRLELAGLKSVDEAGLGALRALHARGVAVTGASPYFRLLLGLGKRRTTRKPPARPEAPEAAKGARRSRRAR
jgi:hypothetical protein